MRVSFVRGTETGLKRRRACRTSIRTRTRLSSAHFLCRYLPVSVKDSSVVYVCVCVFVRCSCAGDAFFLFSLYIFRDSRENKKAPAGRFTFNG